MPVPSPQPQPQPKPKPKGRGGWLVAIGAVVIGTLLFIVMMAVIEVGGLSGRIAYATSSGIMTVGPDGSDPRPVPGTGPGDTDPAWAPDGSSLVYRSESGLRVVAMVDGGLEGQLTVGNDFSPAWSPDGTTIAFASDRAAEAGSPLQIFEVEAAGGEPRLLRQFSVEEHDPAWAPDSSRILFASGTRTERELVLFDPASGFAAITSNVFDDVDPAWSPDGEWIAFASTSGGNFDIWRMKLDGSELEQLTTGPAVDHDPAFSPDGRGIAFSRSEGATTQIVVLNMESREEIVVSGGDTGGSYPTWR